MYNRYRDNIYYTCKIIMNNNITDNTLKMYTIMKNTYALGFTLLSIIYNLFIEPSHGSQLIFLSAGYLNS